MESWHGEHGTDPIAPLAHGAMRGQAAARGAGGWPAARGGGVVPLEPSLTGRPAEPAAGATRIDDEREPA